MTMMANQIGAHRIITGIRIPHVCGVPNLSEEQDKAVRKEIVKTALMSIQTEVTVSTIFSPDIKYSAI
jgi:glycine reductase complex component B subunit gamma